MITKKEKQRIMKGVNYSENFAIGSLFFGNKLNLYLFEEMKKKGYELLSVTFGNAYFRRNK